MTILTTEEIEKFKDLRLSDSKKIRIRKEIFEKLKLFEEKLMQKNSNSYGLPHYLALEHHQGRRTLKSLINELEINSSYLYKIFAHFNIPRLSPSESRERSHDYENNIKERINLDTMDKIMNFYDSILTHKKTRGPNHLVNPGDLVDEVSRGTNFSQDVVEKYLTEYFIEQGRKDIYT